MLCILRAGYGLCDDRADHGVEILEDAFVLDAQDSPPEVGEETVTARVVALTVLVRRLIQLDDQANGGAGEIDDGVADDELAPEGEARPRASESAPEALLRAGGGAAHAEGSLFEERCLLSGDETTSEHEDLR